MTDENNEGGYVDSYVRSAVSKVMFYYMRNSNRDISHSGHKPSRSGSPREYVATDPVKVVLATPRGHATIARIGESVYHVTLSDNLLKYSPSPLPTVNIDY